MSTSPSWFDQDKFSRLVKKVGTKPPSAQPGAGQASSAKALSKPLLKEAQLPSGEKEPEPQPRISLLPPQAQLPPEEKIEEEKIPEPAPPIRLHPPEAQLPPAEEKADEALEEKPAEKLEEKPVEKPAPAVLRAPSSFEPPREGKRLSSRLPKLNLSAQEPEPVPDTQIADEAPPIPPPLHADAGAPVEPEPEPKEEKGWPPLPEASKRPPTAVLRMMTSQPLSLGKRPEPAPAFPPKAESNPEPIRAPDAPAPPEAKAPPMAGGVTSTGRLSHRTTPLPALKSLFQYEIPGGQGVIHGKAPAEPSAPKAPLPTFSFSKLPGKTSTETLPPVADDEEDVPSFAGISDAGHLAEAAEAELTAENLAAEWGKTDDLKGQLDRITRERDDALAESENLLKQLREQGEKPAAANNRSADAAEIDFLTKERDQVRGDYIKLREDFEKLKQEQLHAKSEPAPAPVGPDPEQEKELEKLRQDLAEKDRELRATKLQIKATPPPAAPDSGLEKEIEKLRQEIEGKDRELDLVKAQLDDIPEPVNSELEHEVEKLKGELAEKDREMVALKVASGQADAAMENLKEEIAGVRNEVKKAQTEASVAQRGLALSQKALQETREATESAK